MQIFELRAEVESWLIGLALPLASDSDHNTARRFADKYKDSTDPVVAWDYNWQFHEALFRPANKPYIIDHIKTLHARTARYVRIQLSLATDKKRTIAEHEKLLAYFISKNPKAKSYQRKHILSAAEKLTSRLTKVAQR